MSDWRGAIEQMKSSSDTQRQQELEGKLREAQREEKNWQENRDHRKVLKLLSSSGALG